MKAGKESFVHLTSISVLKFLVSRMSLVQNNVPPVHTPLHVDPVHMDTQEMEESVKVNTKIFHLLTSSLS